MKVDTLLGIYQFCSDYHGGQWSRGYRLLCTTDKALKRKKIGGDYLSKAYRAYGLETYEYLEKHYIDKV